MRDCEREIIHFRAGNGRKAASGAGKNLITTTSITYVRKVVVVHLHATVGGHLREEVCRANEEIIANYVTDHFLIQIAIIYVLPIGILKQTTSVLNIKAYCRH